MKTLVDGFGMGLYTVPYNGKTGIGHNGGIDGFASQAYFFQEGNLIVVNLVNAISSDLSFNDLLIATLNSSYKLPVNIPEFPEKVQVPVATLESYIGLYKSKELPLDITTVVKDGILLAQASGQSAFPLTPTSPTEFIFIPAGVKIIFFPAENSMTLHQGGKTYKYTKSTM